MLLLFIRTIELPLYYASLKLYNKCHSSNKVQSITQVNQNNKETSAARGKICIEYSDVTNYNCNRRGLLIIKGNPAFRQVNKRGYW